MHMKMDAAHIYYLKVALRDRLLVIKYVLESPFLLPSFPFKEVMGEYSAAYMRVFLYSSVKQHLKVGL